jgi:hypothetical protein
MARLNLDERLVRVREAEKRLILEAMAVAFLEPGLSQKLQQALRPVAAKHLRLMTAPEPVRAALPAGGGQ